MAVAKTEDTQEPIWSVQEKKKKKKDITDSHTLRSKILWSDGTKMEPQANHNASTIPTLDSGLNLKIKHMIRKTRPMKATVL